MRILIYQPRVSYYVGGGEIVPINQAKLLIEKGFDVIFVTSCADWIKESDIFKEFKNLFRVMPNSNYTKFTDMILNNKLELLEIHHG